MTLTAQARPAPYDNSVQQVRIDLAAAYRLIHRLGLDDSIYTPYLGPASRADMTAS